MLVTPAPGSQRVKLSTIHREVSNYTSPHSQISWRKKVRSLHSILMPSVHVTNYFNIQTSCAARNSGISLANRWSMLLACKARFSCVSDFPPPLRTIYELQLNQYYR